MITNINHVSFTVSNIEKSIIFYRDILGLKLLDISTRGVEFSEQVTGIKGADLKIAYFEVNNCKVELIEYLAPKGQKIDTTTCNVGSAHICFNVDDFTSFVNNLRKNNVKFSGDICEIPAGPNKGKSVLYFEDNDSNSIELISNETKNKY